MATFMDFITAIEPASFILGVIFLFVIFFIIKKVRKKKGKKIKEGTGFKSIRESIFEAGMKVVEGNKLINEGYVKIKELEEAFKELVDGGEK